MIVYCRQCDSGFIVAIGHAAALGLCPACAPRDTVTKPPTRKRKSRKPRKKD